MKKIAFLTAATSFFTPAIALAQTNINIAPPAQGFKTLGDAITKILTLSFIVALLVVLAMLIWGAFEWIASGGDKEAVGKARNRIISALVGLAVLAIVFALFRVTGQFLGFGIGNDGNIIFNIPTPSGAPTPPPAGT